MKNAPLTVLAVAVGFLMLARPILAHHSDAIYDNEHPVELAGTVTGYVFINPHVQIRFEVKDGNGSVVQWVAESGPVQRLYRIGWTKDTLKPGDQIKIVGDPARDGRKLLNLKKLVTPSGQELGQH